MRTKHGAAAFIFAGGLGALVLLSSGRLTLAPAPSSVNGLQVLAGNFQSSASADYASQGKAVAPQRAAKPATASADGVN